MKKIIIVLSFVVSSLVTANEITDIKLRTAFGNKAQIMMIFKEAPSTPSSFTIEDKKKMIFDFEKVNIALNTDKTKQDIAIGALKDIELVQDKDTARLVVNVLKTVPYSISQDRNQVVITLENEMLQALNSDNDDYTIKSLDFRRGDEGEGRVIIEFSNDSVPVDFLSMDNKIKVTFKGATLPENLSRRYDVSDFGTNIYKLVMQRKNNDTVLEILARGDYQNTGFQLENKYIIEVRPMKEIELISQKTQKFKFTGEKISLNFQDIEIRSVLQLLAEFTGLNIIASDSVDGSVTLRLEDIPWDQALDFILKSKNLGKREDRDLILIAPISEIAEREAQELEVNSTQEKLSSLVSEFIQVNYAKASDISSTLKSSENTILSERGNVSVDERTNVLLLKDTPEKLLEIKELVERLDRMVRQVMIEVQIIEVSDNFNEAFGVKLGGAATPQLGRNTLGIGPTIGEARTFADDPTSKTTSSGNLFYSLTNAGASSKLGLALAKLPSGTLLDLELQASELESKSNTIARPKLLTLDQQTATIETGTDIPYQTTSAEGADATTTFKKAVLKLDVTPQITPNNKIGIELSVNQDEPGENINGQTSISTTALSTHVLVDNGETVVLGGIFKVKESLNRNKIPYFADIPLIGRLFKDKSASNVKTEVLVFMTPRIIESLADRKRVL